jgi:hypothetical protein
MPANTSSKPACAIPEWHVHVWKAKEVRDLVHRRAQGLNVNCVDIVKIDVEGAELHVLRGFKDSIVKFKPKIIIEVKEFNRKGVFEFFEEVNYTCHHIPEEESGEYFICTPRS